MSSKTYKLRAIVLRKTKLGEKDLIVTMLGESGDLVKGVAKGARKPGGSLASRIELFTTVDVLMAQGRSLDVVCEARFADGRAPDLGLEQAVCAAPIAELLCSVAQPDLPQPRLFDMARSAVAHLSAASGNPPAALAIAAACLWKVMAQAGFRPSFAHCALCGCEVNDAGACQTALSVGDGGVICSSCMRPADSIVADWETLRWCEALIRSSFDEVAALGMGSDAAFGSLQLSRLWIRTHTGRDLKSLDFLFSSGLF